MDETVRPITKDKMALFHLQGFIDGNNAPSLITVQDITYTATLDVEAALINFEKIIFFNKKGIDFLADILKHIKNRMGVMVGIYGYSKKSYNSILAFYPEGAPFCMFDDLKTASLFVGLSEIQKDSIIIFHTKDKNQKNQISLELFNRGFQAVYLEEQREFESRRVARIENPSLFAHSFEMTHLISQNERVATHLYGKVVVYTLSGYIDGGINERFDIAYHVKSLNVGFKLFVFDGERIKSMNVHGVSFIAKLSVSAAEWGATICLTGMNEEKLQPKLREELLASGIMFYESLDELLLDKELLENYSGGASLNKRSKRKINKTLVESLPVFVNCAIKSLSTLTGTTAIKQSVNIMPLKIDTDKSTMLASSIGFYGDLDGLIVLVFSRNIAVKSCKILLSHDENLTDKELEDALSEFVNIVAGSVKSALADKGTKITITLPRTFMHLDELLLSVEAKNGVQVVLSFDSEPFYFFLSR